MDIYKSRSKAGTLIKIIDQHESRTNRKQQSKTQIIYVNSGNIFLRQLYVITG